MVLFKVHMFEPTLKSLLLPHLVPTFGKDTKTRLVPTLGKGHTKAMVLIFKSL